MTQTTKLFNDKAKTEKPKRKPKRKPRTSTLSVRFTEREREYLELKAGQLPISTFVRQLALEEEVLEDRPKLKKVASDDQKLVLRVLAAWSKTNMTSNITQLALATQNSPQLFTAELCMFVRAAKNDVDAIVKTLREGLGVKDSALLLKVLDRLKNPHIAKKLNQLVLTINAGAFLLSPELHALILEICAEIDFICTKLHDALVID